MNKNILTSTMEHPDAVAPLRTTSGEHRDCSFQGTKACSFCQAESVKIQHELRLCRGENNVSQKRSYFFSVP